MFELVTTATLSAELEEGRAQLLVVAGRIEDAVALAPRRDLSGWKGPAAAAYQQALDRLARELAAAGELLRSATDLMGVAARELGAHG